MDQVKGSQYLLLTTRSRMEALLVNDKYNLLNC